MLSTVQIVSWGVLYYAFAVFLIPMQPDLGFTADVVRRAEAMGFTPRCGFEFEWFNFKETPHSLGEKDHSDPTPLTPGMFGYSVLRMNQNQPFLNALIDEMAAFRVPIEGLHTETGPGVFEAAILYDRPLEAADRAVAVAAAGRASNRSSDEAAGRPLHSST